MIAKFKYANFHGRLWFLVGCFAAAATLQAQQRPVPGPPSVATTPAAALKNSAAAPAVYGDASYGLVVAPSKREQSRVFYLTIYQASENVASGWNGSVIPNQPGTTSQAFRDAIALRINYFRAMVGIPAAITLSDAYNAGDQQAALMMSANNDENHNPPTTWLDYSAAGAQSAWRSNLTLANGPAAIDNYIEDVGSDNTPVGHRRGLLNPPTEQMGSGDVDATIDSSGHTIYSAANALQVNDTTSTTTRPATRESYIAWPPPGYVPYGLIYDRWSFAYPDADFSQATVTMTAGGAPVTVQIVSRDVSFDDPTLVWVPQSLTFAADNSTSSAPAAQQETTCHVAIDNVLVGGQAKSFSYDVTGIDSQLVGADTVYPIISGPALIQPAADNTYTFAAVPGATGYEWEADPMSAATLEYNAENGPGDVTIDPPGAEVIATDMPANGAASYQFIAYPPVTMTLNADIVPAAGGTLQFSSLLGYATTAETARVQLSTDHGQTWKDLYDQTGTNAPEAGYTLRSIDLTPFAGQECRLRFNYASTGNYFPKAVDGGWYVDDITVTGVHTLTSGTPTMLAAGNTVFTFVPAAGSYALRVRPVFYGSYPLASLDALKLVSSSVTDLVHPPFFAGEAYVANGVYYLQFPNDDYFGYYTYLSDPGYIYHFDLGYEYVFDAADGKGGAYFYDFRSSSFFYTSPMFPFPYLYDFSLNSVTYYYPDPTNPGRYNTDGVRYFYDFSSGMTIAK